MKKYLFSAITLLALFGCDKLANAPAVLNPAVNTANQSGSTAMMKTFKVTLESLSGGPLSPGIFVIHQSGMPLFMDGEKDRGLGLEMIAEDGDPKTLMNAVPGSMVFNIPVGESVPGPALPGKKYEFTFQAKPGDMLSFATMYVQSNDGFYAFSPKGLPLFVGNEPMMGDLTSKVMLWDGGTEINQEPGKGADQAPRQKASNMGASESEKIMPMMERKDGFTYSPALRLSIEAK